MRPCANCKEDIGDHSEGKLQKCLIKLSEKILSQIIIFYQGTYTLRDIEQGEEK